MLSWIIRLIFRVILKGKEHLKFDEPTIIMPNHVSFLDAVILSAILPKEVCFVVDTQIAKQFSWVMWMRKHITVDSMNPYSVRQMIAVVKKGTPVVIFPEGRLTVTGGLMKVYSGAAFMAMKAHARVLPIWLEGVQFSRFTRMRGKFPVQWLPQISVSVGAPYFLERNPEVSIKVDKLRLADEILIHLQEMGYQARSKTNVNLFEELVRTANRFGLKTEIAEDVNRKVKYKDLLVGARVLSQPFADILKDESRVGVLLPNVIAHVVTLFALFKIGKSPAIFNLTAGAEAWRSNCAVADLRTVFTSRAFVEKANLQDEIAILEQEIRVIYLEDIRKNLTSIQKLRGAILPGRTTVAPKNSDVILFTSGTESKPKGVVLSHDHIFANVNQALIVIDLTKEDKIFNALPMFHSFGLTAGTIMPLLSGVSVYLYPSPLHYRIIPEIIYDKNCTGLFGTSTFLAGYAKYAHDYDFRSLRYVVSGAEKLREETRNVWSERFGIRILEGYGATETAPIISVNTPLFFRQGSVGRPVPAIEYRLEPVEGISQGGRLFVKGPNVMKGYLIDGKGFVPASEWYDTGDVVSIDEKGFFTILARLKRFAKVAGEMVSLTVVEDVLEKALNDPEGLVAAVSIPDASKGEKIIAFVTKPLAMRSVQQVIAEQRRSPLISPATIKVIEQMPLLGSGKTDYVKLQQIANGQ